eukprot:15462131-Alexandrium_andersonii.AAC.1
MDKDKLVRQGALLSDLQAAQPNLSFVKSKFEAGLLIIAKQRVAKGAWSMDSAAQKDWVITIAARVRLACRHLSQALLKTPRAPWLKLFKFVSGGAKLKPDKPKGAIATKPAEDLPAKEEASEEEEEEEQEEAEEEEEAAEPEQLEPTYYYGFDTEFAKPWRANTDGSGKELAIKVEVPDDAD